MPSSRQKATCSGALSRAPDSSAPLLDPGMRARLSIGNREISGPPAVAERQAVKAESRVSQLGSEEMRQVLFDYLACQRVADAYRTKLGARDADHERLRKAFDTG